LLSCPLAPLAAIRAIRRFDNGKFRFDNGKFRFTICVRKCIVTAVGRPCGFATERLLFCNNRPAVNRAVAFCYLLFCAAKAVKSMLVRISEDPLLAIIYFTYFACAVLAVWKLSFAVNGAVKRAETFYLPMKKWERAYIAVAFIALLALFAASLLDTGIKGLASVAFMPFMLVFRPSARLVRRVGGEYYYSDDWFRKNVRIETPKCVHEGNHAVVIFKTIGKKQKLVQFNIPADNALFFEGGA
jgi:hypothetical protein